MAFRVGFSKVVVGFMVEIDESIAGRGVGKGLVGFQRFGGCSLVGESAVGKKGL